MKKDNLTTKFTQHILILIIFALFCAGCATTTQQVSSKIYPSTKPENIIVLYKNPTRDYEIISYVRALQKTIWEENDSLIQRCREEAAKSGADAIIITDIGNESSLPGVSVRAKAIKWKE